MPTELVVIQQDEKSQHKNKAKALKVLRSRLYDMERQARASRIHPATFDLAGLPQVRIPYRMWRAPNGRAERRYWEGRL